MTNAKYRNNLPQLNGQKLLTDGGLETTLIFHDGIDLPYFAAFDLLRTLEGRRTLKAYYCRYAQVAKDRDIGFILDSPTWRAHQDWGDLMGYNAEALEAANRDAIDLMEEVRSEFETDTAPFVINASIGPRGDGYNPAKLMTTDEAEAYHSAHVNTFADAGVDMVTALTMTHVEEAIGVTRAAQSAGVPIAVAFTVETDGRLPTGQPIKDAINQVDAETGNGSVYFMINCAHPEHFQDALEAGEIWLERIAGIRANASRMSHAELDNAEELDDGNPVEFGQQYRELQAVLPNLAVAGGCCGTDHRHIEEIYQSCFHQHAA